MGDASPERGDVGALTTRLIDEFRTRLDDTLIIAILSDFDLTQQFDEAQSLLNRLAQDVTAEEASVFNATFVDPLDGAPATRPADDLAGLEWPDTTDTSQSTTGSARISCDSSADTDWAYSLSGRFETLDLPKDVNVTTLDEDGKIAELKVMFAGLSEVDLQLTLKKAKGDFTMACEELLNLQYLEENGLRPKGIDGAFRDGEPAVYKGRTVVLKDKSKNRLDVEYRLTPLNLSEEDTVITKPTAPRQLARRSSLPRLAPPHSAASRSVTSTPSSPAIGPGDWQTIQTKKKTYTELANDAAASRAFAAQTQEAAHAAWRRGKSDVLFRPVAGVMAERAREQRAQARALESEQYEAFVDQTSSTDSIDLHGVPVADGVRIALDRTQAWWATLGEDRARKAREHGFIVVTGLGNHSASGVSRLRQEVGAALKREGWRVRTETGQYVVHGRS